MLSRRLLTLSSGVITLHTSVTILEEALFSRESFRSKAGSTFMTLVFYALAAAVYAPRTAGKRVWPSSSAARMVWTAATLYVATTTLSKTALAYIDMPTQAVLKSAKLLPVMVGSIVILGKGFTLREWIAAAMLVTGIAAFSASNHAEPVGFGGRGHGHSDHSGGPPRQSLRGGACVVVALICDAALGNYQKRVLQHGVEVSQLMFFQSLCGLAYMGVACAAAGTLLPGAALLFAEPPVALMLFAWAGALTAGTALVLRLVDEYSAVTAITVTTLRKAGTLAASFVLFPKPIGPGHPLGAALVLASAFVKAGVGPTRCSSGSAGRGRGSGIGSGGIASAADGVSSTSTVLLV